MNRVRSFDLNRLNAIGWIVVLCTIGFALLECVLLAGICKAAGLAPKELPRVVMFPLLLLALAFFATCRWLLGLYRVSIVRA